VGCPKIAIVSVDEKHDQEPFTNHLIEWCEDRGRQREHIPIMGKWGWGGGEGGVKRRSERISQEALPTEKSNSPLYNWRPTSGWEMNDIITHPYRWEVKDLTSHPTDSEVNDLIPLPTAKR
jgi:hypothetical protein